MLRELLGAVAGHLDSCRDTGEYGGLGTSLLFGSEELSATYPRGVGCYYQDVLVTADFSVRMSSVVSVVYFLFQDAFTKVPREHVLSSILHLSTLVGWGADKTAVLLKMSRFILEQCYFKIFGEVYKQCAGTPMGSYW